MEMVINAMNDDVIKALPFSLNPKIKPISEMIIKLIPKAISYTLRIKSWIHKCTSKNKL